MKKTSLRIVVFVLLAGLLVACQKSNSDQKKLQVAVSIVPQETFVKAVGGDLVDVVTLIPPGSSPANYQPTPKQMARLSESSIYFSIGVPAETANIMHKIEDFNEDIKIVELADIVDEQYSARFFEEDHEENEHAHEEEHGEEHEEDVHVEGSHSEETHEEDEEGHSHAGRDPHIWMSPKRVMVMVKAIRDELITVDPNNQSIYEENASKYIQQLQNLDQEIKTNLENLENKTFIIMHPSMGYFAEDYGLTMVAIEEDGKEATANRLQGIIDLAREEDIKVIFYQAEFDNQQAETLVLEIDGETLAFEPLAPDYITNMTKINETFERVLEVQ